MFLHLLLCLSAEITRHGLVFAKFWKMLVLGLCTVIQIFGTVRTHYLMKVFQWCINTV